MERPPQKDERGVSIAMPSDRERFQLATIELCIEQGWESVTVEALLAGPG